MSETKYLKCPCQKCGASIEFPARGIGSAVPCPHCGEKTTLYAPPAVAGETAAPPSAVETPFLHPAPVVAAAESFSAASASSDPDEASVEAPTMEAPTAEGKPRRRVMTMVLLAGLLAGAGGTLFAFRDKLTGARSAASNDPALSGNAQAPTKTDPESPQRSPSTVGKAPKSPDDLKVGAIALEKARGSSLIYAVGVLRNESDHQRFGVNIELELMDAKGARAGFAKDYRSVIEPRQEWRFRALVLDSKAASAKLAKIREEE